MKSPFIEGNVQLALCSVGESVYVCECVRARGGGGGGGGGHARICPSVCVALG